MKECIVGLAGNPNVGKTTVFNQLTGMHQHVGNWPGKTVERAEGHFDHDDTRFDVVDLLVTYPVAGEFSFVNSRECFITAQYRTICARPKTHRAGRSIVPSRFLTHTSCIDRAYHTVAAHHVECQRERCSIPRDDCPIVTRRRSVDALEGRQSQFV